LETGADNAGRGGATLAAVTFLLLVAATLAARAADAAADGETLAAENMLHPLDNYTADMFRRGEQAYYQPLQPFPGWASWAPTNWMTVHLDFEAWLGGVPSLGLKFGSLKQRGVFPAAAFETMFQYLPQRINLLENYDYLDIIRAGASSTTRVNLSWRLSPTFRIHFSPGVTYSHNLLIRSSHRSTNRGASYHKLVAPDASLAADWRPLGWLATAAAASYGSTFVYLDNVPLKYQLCSGVRLAPFYRMNFGPLKNFRAELAFEYFHFADAGESVAGPGGYLYWQWGGG